MIFVSYEVIGCFLCYLCVDTLLEMKEIKIMALILSLFPQIVHQNS